MREGEPYLRSDRPGWWIRWRELGPDGKSRRRKMYAGKDLETARALLARKQANEFARRIGASRSVTLAEFAAAELFPVVRARLRPKSFEAFSGRVVLAGEYFGATPIDAIGRVEATAYLSQLDVAPMTVRNYRTALNVTWKLAIERLAARENPWRDIQLPRAQDRPVPYLSEADLQRIYEAQPPHLAALVRFLGETGARLGEALALRWEDVATDGKRFTIRASKTGRTRVVPLTEEARRAIGKRADAGARVFANFHGAMPRAWRDHWRAAVTKVGHPTLRLHDLRHACASLLVRAGTPIPSVSRWLGHSTPALVLTRYGHHAPANELDDALARRERARGGTPRARPVRSAPRPAPGSPRGRRSR